MVALKANYLEHKENLKACKKVGHFTAVSGPNKAHMDTISKLPKIIEICWCVVTMAQVYHHNGFKAFFTV